MCQSFIHMLEFCWEMPWTFPRILHWEIGVGRWFPFHAPKVSLFEPENIWKWWYPLVKFVCRMISSKGAGFKIRKVFKNGWVSPLKLENLQSEAKVLPSLSQTLNEISEWSQGIRFQHYQLTSSLATRLQYYNKMNCNCRGLGSRMEGEIGLPKIESHEIESKMSPSQLARLQLMNLHLHLPIFC